jgi:thymidine kinase
LKLLKVWAGPMCAAKTTGALHVARRYARHGKKVVLIRPISSRRGHELDSTKLSTKNGEMFPCYEVSHVEETCDLLTNADVVWFDEPNHFDDEEKLIKLIPIVRRASIVLISGLGSTSELEPFGKCMPFLLATADYVEWKTADCDICNTHGTATRSLYVGETPKSGQLKVGGSEYYRPACSTCWNNLRKLHS